MQIRKGKNFYKCSKIRTKTIRGMQTIKFKILESVSSAEVVSLFEDDTFYFYDDVLNSKMIETYKTKLVGLSITYNEDSTCDITIKLTKRSG